MRALQRYEIYLRDKRPLGVMFTHPELDGWWKEKEKEITAEQKRKYPLPPSYAKDPKFMEWYRKYEKEIEDLIEKKYHSHSRRQKKGE